MNHLLETELNKDRRPLCTHGIFIDVQSFSWVVARYDVKNG
ncbi:MAG TPA: hypothetical protein VN903_39930 [Polyangia bacterium]|jgi:hypothetical protein|nr:hypothetical protein [Polyangia bacterium]